MEPAELIGGLARGITFLRHLLEMIVTMALGMVAGAAVFLAAGGLMLEEALRRHPISFTVVMAFSMTAPMVAWMRYRGHGWRSCTWMTAAMVVPAIPLICLRVAEVVSGPICGAYCGLSLAAMVLVMLYRRSEYTGSHAPA